MRHKTTLITLNAIWLIWIPLHVILASSLSTSPLVNGLASLGPHRRLEVALKVLLQVKIARAIVLIRVLLNKSLIHSRVVTPVPTQIQMVAKMPHKVCYLPISISLPVVDLAAVLVDKSKLNPERGGALIVKRIELVKNGAVVDREDELVNPFTLVQTLTEGHAYVNVVLAVAKKQRDDLDTLLLPTAFNFKSLLGLKGRENNCWPDNSLNLQVCLAKVVTNAV